MVEKFEEYLEDFGSLDVICEICEIDRLEVLNLLYEEFLFDPKKLESSFGDDNGIDD